MFDRLGDADMSEIEKKVIDHARTRPIEDADKEAQAEVEGRHHVASTRPCASYPKCIEVEHGRGCCMCGYFGEYGG